MLGLPEKVRACLFDLDGVLTDTASVHTKAWKATFDAFLSERAKRTGDEFVPFDAAADYRKYVDGKKREDGVRSFLESRGIELPEGSADDSGDAETIHGLGNRKNDMFQQVLEKDGVEVFDGSRRYLEAVVGRGAGHRRRIVQRQHPRGTQDHRPGPIHPAARGRQHAARRAHPRQARPRLVSCAVRNCSASPRTPPRYSRTRCQAWRPAVPVTSGSW